MQQFSRELQCRSGQNGAEKDTDLTDNGRTEPAGDVQQAQIRRHEEGVRAVGAVRLRDCLNHLQQHQQAVPVREHRHGQGPAEVHRV